MKQIPGRLVFLFEAVLLGVPVGLVCVFYASYMAINSFSGLIDGVPLRDWAGAVLWLMLGVASAIAIAAVIAVWRLSLAYLVHGAKVLSECPAVWWKLTMIGVVVAVLGLLSFAGSQLIFLSGGSAGLLSICAFFSFGAPLLVPALHLLWTRRRTLQLHSS